MLHLLSKSDGNKTGCEDVRRGTSLQRVCFRLVRVGIATQPCNGRVNEVARETRAMSGQSPTPTNAPVNRSWFGGQAPVKRCLARKSLS